MKKRFDLDREAGWQAYKIANVFLVWDVHVRDDKITAQKIISYVIQQWYKLGRWHRSRELSEKRKHLVKALEEIKKHQETVWPKGFKNSPQWIIASTALRKAR